MVKMALGEDMLVAMDACIPDDAIQNALKTYSRGNRGVEAALVRMILLVRKRAKD